MSEYFVDLSEYQKNVDFATLKKSGINFVILRSTKKRNAVDARFYRNVMECVSNGIGFDVYKYMYATTVKQAEEEAIKLVEQLIGLGQCVSQMTVWLDIEDKMLPYHDTILMRKMIIKFREIIENYGMTFGIYTSMSLYRYNLPKDIHGRYWIARYPSSKKFIYGEHTPNMGKCPRMREGDSLMGWQFTSQAVVPGISGLCDLNIFTM